MQKALQVLQDKSNFAPGEWEKIIGVIYEKCRVAGLTDSLEEFSRDFFGTIELMKKDLADDSFAE